MIKSNAMTQFGYVNADDFDTLLLDLGIDPDAPELTEDECNRIRQHIADMGASKALPSASLNADIPNADMANSLTVTDDEVLGLAEATGVDLDVVMTAAAHVEDLEALVLWVENYKQLEAEQEIKESARQQFELDQLRKKEAALSERLNAALNKRKPDIDAIRKRLGVKVPTSVNNLGTWDGKPGTDGEPDFLKKAREAFAKN